MSFTVRWMAKGGAYWEGIEAPVFDTQAEAEAYARDLGWNSRSVGRTMVIPTSAPVDHAWTDGKVVPVC